MLSGCASWPTANRESTLVTERERASLMNLDIWRMEGRIGVQAKNDAWQAHISWVHESSQDRLLIQGPLNQGLISIALRKGLIYINQGHGEGALSREPEKTLQERLGFSVPLYSLRYWLLGVPDPGEAHRVSSDKAVVSGFVQAGWLLDVADYKAVDGYRLPGKLKIQGNDVKLKLVIDSWNIGGQP